MTEFPTRYVSSFVVELISDFHIYCNKKYNLSADEVAIITLVASESTRTIREDKFFIQNYGWEKDAFPNVVRQAITTKIIHTSLGMSRETTRRKVNALVKKGFLKRTENGVIFPEQTNGDDYTAEFRLHLYHKMEKLMGYMDKIPGRHQ